MHETLELSAAVQAALVWEAGRLDILVLVTADHETGGLAVTQDNGVGAYPEVTWSTTGHSGANVPAYAWGQNAGVISGVMDNTDLSSLCRVVLEHRAVFPPSAPGNLRVSPIH